MATTTTNGNLTPPALPAASTSPSPTKRKHPDTDVAVSLPNGAPVKEKVVNRTVRALPLVLGDILSVLKSYDTRPSILNHALSSSTRSSSGESDSKRAKLTPPSGPLTIASQVQNGAYDSLDALEKDVEKACADIIPDVEGTERAVVQPSLEELKLQSQALAFQKLAVDLISRERARGTHQAENKEAGTSTVETDLAKNDEDAVQIKEEFDNEDFTEGRTVLTLYGSAQGPKQLFSSLQQPTRVSATGGNKTSNLDAAPKVVLPLRESNLPNIISTSDILPTDEAETKPKFRTLGELCKPPAHLPQLSPPKHAKSMSTRGNTVTFAPVEVLPKPSRASAHSYANQKLGTGHWLGYGGVDTPKDPASPTAKQKSRQRALSTGEAQLPPSGATLAAVQQAKEDALFRSVYSSFAPSRDDATTIVPEETKNMVWWQKVGEKRFNETFPIDPTLLDLDDLTTTEVEETPEDIADEAERFKDAVEHFEPAESDPFEMTEEPEVDRSIDEILKEISELIETLASHQRNRNASLATNPRTPVMQNSSLANLAGSPSTPSSEEVDVYQILKSQLKLMISQLPPYAVAKLNGEQLEELNISRTILIETKDATGVLEEDQLTRLAKGAAHGAVAPPSLSRMASAGSAHYPASSTQYSRSTPSVHSARPPPTPAYYSQQQPVHRSPSVHYQRQSSNAGQHYQTPAAAYGNSTPRQSYPNSSFTQPTPRTSYNQPAPSSFYPQRAAQTPNYGGGVSNSQYFQPTQHAQQHNRYSQQPQPPQQNGYYQRPHSATSFNYGAAPSPHARTESPLKGNPPAGQQPYGTRPTYGTPAANGQVRSIYYPQGASQGSQYAGGQPSTPTTAGQPGYSQQMLLDRQQQAQAAAQSQARIAAQSSFRQGSGTPGPPTPQYGSQTPQPNGTPMVS